MKKLFLLFLFGAIGFVLSFQSNLAQGIPAPVGGANIGHRHSLPVDHKKTYDKVQPSGYKWTLKKVTVEIPRPTFGEIENKDIYEERRADWNIVDVHFCLIFVEPGPDNQFFKYVVTVVVQGPERRYETDVFTWTYQTIQNGNFVHITDKGQIRTKELKGYNPNETFLGAKGDDVYSFFSNSVFVSRDTGASWEMDTVGLNGARNYSLALNSKQDVYLGTTKGLYTQTAKGTQWSNLPGYPTGSCPIVFIDRTDRIFCTGGKGLYISNDNGATFELDTAGLSIGTAIPKVTAICDDDDGNIYVILDGMKIFKSNTGTQPFVQVGQTLEFLTTYLKPLDMLISSISADSKNIVVNTVFGYFLSTDGGSTWKEYNYEPTIVCYGLAETSQGRLITSTDLGVFIKDATDTVWVKTMPKNSYLKAGKIFRSNDGTLITTGGYSAPSTNAMIWKSTDNGTNWTLDTLGYSSMKIDYFFVDEEGTMHAATYGNGVEKAKLFVRPTGGVWTGDNNGFDAESATIVNCLGSDRHGNLYVATSAQALPKLYVRPLSGVTWMPDTVGIKGINIYDISALKDGTVLAGGYQTPLLKKSVGGTWQTINNPPGTGGNSCFVVNVDESNAIWTQWTAFNSSFESIGTGVFYSTDAGNSWVSKDFDTVTFRQLIKTKDGMYAVSYYDGLFKFTKTISAVSEIPSVSLNTLTVSPNPAKNEMHISYSIPKRCDITLSIFDFTGNKIAQIINEPKEAGSYQTGWSNEVLANGVYIVKLSTPYETITKAVTILK